MTEKTIGDLTPKQRAWNKHKQAQREQRKHLRHLGALGVARRHRAHVVRIVHTDWWKEQPPTPIVRVPRGNPCRNPTALPSRDNGLLSALSRVLGRSLRAVPA